MTLYMRDLEKIEEGRAEGRKTAIYSLVEKGKLTLQDGAEELGVPEEEFEMDMVANGFKMP